MHSSRPLEYWLPDGSAMMFELLARIQRRYFLPIIFLSKSEWNILGKCPASDLKDSRDGVMYVEDKYDIPYR